MRLIKSLFFLLLLSVNASAAVLFSDDYEAGETVSLIHNTPSLLTTEIVGSWSVLWINSPCTAEIVNLASTGRSGYGYHTTWNTYSESEPPSGAYESNLQPAYGAVSATYPDSMFIGFWYKKTLASGGTNAWLKMFWTRVGANTRAALPDIRMDDGQWVWFYNNLTPHLTGYMDTDMGWKYYIFEMRGASTTGGTDGIIRTWVDGVSIYEDTAVNFGSDNNRYIVFTALGGNLSEDYFDNGGSEFSHYYDSFIVATTRAEVEEFLGVGPSPSTPTIRNGSIR